MDSKGMGKRQYLCNGGREDRTIEEGKELKEALEVVASPLAAEEVRPIRGLQFVHTGK